MTRSPAVPILVAVLVSGCSGSRHKVADSCVRSSATVEPTATTRAAGGTSKPLGAYESGETYGAT